MLIGLSAANYQRDKQNLKDVVRKFHNRFSTNVSATNGRKEWCSLYDILMAVENFDHECTLVYTFLVSPATRSPANKRISHQTVDENIIYLDALDTSIVEKWMEWASGVQAIKFDYVGFSELDLLDEDTVLWLKQDILQSKSRSTVAVTKRSNKQSCKSIGCTEFDFLCLSMDLVRILKIQSFSPLEDNGQFSSNTRLLKSLVSSRNQHGSIDDIMFKAMSKESEVELSTLLKKLQVSDVQQDAPFSPSTEDYGKAPLTAVFMNGYLHDPSYLWAFSFPRILLKQMSIHVRNPSGLRILGHEARTEKLWRVTPTAPIGESKEEVSDLVEILQGGRELQNEMDIIFARNIAIPGLIYKHPDLFEFCEYHRKPRKHRNRKILKTTNHSTCPVIVSFPIGTKTCDHCSPEWYLEISDSMHLKTLSSSNWETISLIQAHLPVNGNVSSELPKELASLFDPSRWKFIASKGCTIAYVSRWNERKGQNRMTKQLLDFANAGLLTGMPSTTICFAGTAEGYTKQREKILRQLNTEFDRVKAVDLGFLSFAEQILLFRLAGKSMLWTDFDQSPRIASLSLASGARVLTTEVAQVPDAIIDDDCMVTILHLFDNQTSSMKERAAVVMDFLSREERCVKTNATVERAYSILQEDSFYGPIIERAISMWTRLNFGRERHCFELFSHECELFAMLRKVKKEWNCSDS